jgi:hypothetical protein
MEVIKRTSRAKKAFDNLCQNNRVYEVPEALSQQISKEIQEVSLKAHKEYLHMQNETRRKLRDKKII